MLKSRDKKLTPQELRIFHAYASVLALGMVAFFSGWLFWRLITPRMDFYNELWAPAWQLVHGASPYDTSVLDANLPAAWFPMAIGLFFPLGWLPETLALQVWFIFNILALCLLILLLQEAGRSAFLAFLLALFCFFFPPVLYHLILGQITVTVTLSLILATRFMLRDRRWVSAFFVALALSKPHLVILPILALSLYVHRREGLRGMLSFWVRVLLCSLALCLPLFVAYPNWIPDAISSMASNPIWLYPSLFIVYQRAFPGWEVLLWGLTVALVLLFGWRLWKRLSLMDAVCWSLALSPLISPYVGSWDFVVLLPLLFLAFVDAGWKRRGILILAYLLAWVGMALVQVQPSSDNHFFWWVPLWFIIIIALLRRPDSMNTSTPALP